MKLIICLDDNNGMSFNKRRQTRDIKMREHLYKKLNGNRLLISPYSEKLYSGYENVLVSDNYLEIAQENDYILSEIDDITDILDKCEGLIVYYWHRSYPSDFKVSIPNSFKIINSEDFSGKSHNQISYVEYKNEQY
ncbi:MAG: hypothetical protein Q4B60_04480 [Erysipelotrichaceae bacterium]|nr:hypothetical protein [Erysipelotrichaceae bacterium]